MDNVHAVTEHLKKKLTEKYGDWHRRTLSIVLSKEGKPYYECDGEFYRAYHFVDDVIAYDLVPGAEVFYEAGYSFGEFQGFLTDFDAEVLYDVIPDFHNTKKRFGDFVSAVKNDAVGRAATVQREIDMLLARENIASVVVEQLESGQLPTRVTHNDTKLNNVLIDKETGKGICVIDLDTVMKGSLLYDFGDAVRYGANPAGEEEKNLSKVVFRMDMFTAFLEGFLKTAGDALTKEEIKLLPFSVKLCTYELALRFLGDYINGDTYFFPKYEGINLDRARTQIKLLEEIETVYPQMMEAVQKYL